MKMPKNIASGLGLVVAVLCGSALIAAENNWPSWRGPNHNGSVENANPPIHWSDSENIMWKIDLPGQGSGSPIVWANQIILLTAIDTGAALAGEPSAESAPESDAPADAPGDRRGGRGFGPQRPTTEYQFAVVSFNLQDGSEQWRTVVARAVPHEPGHPTNSYASFSAVTDGERIYASFGSRGIHCLDMQGELLWSTDLGQMETRNQFGEGSSPALVGDTLIVPWDHEAQSSIFALDTASGEVRWQTAREELTTWATPLVVEHEGRTQVITNGSIVRSYDVQTGELLWSCGGQVSNPIPSPVRIDDAVICMTGYRGNAIYAMPLDARGDITDSDEVLWHNHDAAPYVSSPTLYKGQLYFTKERTGAMSSLDARTGEVLYGPQRLSDIRDVYSSPVAAADRIYFTSRDGITTVVQHGRTFEEIAVNQLGEAVDASPAIVGDSLIIRGAEHLYRIAENE